MTMLPDAVRAYEQELLQKADMLAMGLKGLTSAAPERAAEILAEISSRLGRAVAAEPVAAIEERGRGDPRRAAPVVIAARGGGADDIEDFILDILAENPSGPVGPGHRRQSRRGPARDQAQDPGGAPASHGPCGPAVVPGPRPLHPERSRTQPPPGVSPGTIGRDETRRDRHFPRTRVGTSPRTRGEVGALSRAG